MTWHDNFIYYLTSIHLLFIQLIVKKIHLCKIPNSILFRCRLKNKCPLGILARLNERFLSFLQDHIWIPNAAGCPSLPGARFYGASFILKQCRENWGICKCCAYGVHDRLIILKIVFVPKKSFTVSFLYKLRKIKIYYFKQSFCKEISWYYRVYKFNFI